MVSITFWCHNQKDNAFLALVVLYSIPQVQINYARGTDISFSATELSVDHNAMQPQDMLYFK